MNNYFRIIHRYLGYFLAGIMLVYALSGVVMIFRDTDFLKQTQQVERKVEPSLASRDVARIVRVRELKVSKTEGDIIYFENGWYNVKTGDISYSVTELPTLLNKMTQLHKASSGKPLFWLNIFFGISLVFFAVSSFWMFRPSTDVFRKGLYFALAGLVMTIVLIFV